MFTSVYILANLLLVSFTSPIETDKNLSLHNVKAKTGDGVFSLLRRYDLADYKCNISEFYKINELQSSDYLTEGKSYKLPIYLYTYNGVSIRSTIGIKDWDKAVRIKEYNEMLTETKLRKTHFTDSKILWVPHHELHCSTPSESSSPSASNTTETAKSEKFEKTTKQYDLFGKKYGKVEIVDNKLKDQVYYIVSGHGGPDPGTYYSGYSTKICEDEYAYDVSLRLARNLMQHGAKVEIIVRDKNDGIRDDRMFECDKDEYYLGDHRIARSQLSRLADRTKIINDLYYSYKKKGYKNQKAIIIHVDSQNKSKRQDVYFYYYKDSKSGKKLADKLQSTFKSKYAKYQKSRGYHGFVKDRGLFMLRNTLPTAAFIELANIKNKDDHKRLLVKENRQALANWIFEGIIDK